MISRRILIFTLAIILGLLSRSELVVLPEFINAYIGDVIWAFMVFYLFAIAYYKSELRKPLIAAFIFSFTIEFSQLYQAEWINNVRNIKVFALVLGHGFLWSDLLCYSIGIALGYAVETNI